MYVCICMYVCITEFRSLDNKSAVDPFCPAENKTDERASPIHFMWSHRETNIREEGQIKTRCLFFFVATLLTLEIDRPHTLRFLKSNYDRKHPSPKSLQSL
jgi:hypothetical protein